HVDPLPPEEPREPDGAAEPERPRHVDELHAHPSGLDELGEAAAERGEDEDVVPARPRRARDGERDELAAGDVAADHELSHPHLRHTATSSLASPIRSGEMTRSSSPSSAVGGVPS